MRGLGFLFCFVFHFTYVGNVLSIYGNIYKIWSPGHSQPTCICLKTRDEALLVTGPVLFGQGGGTGLCRRRKKESVWGCSPLQCCWCPHVWGLRPTSGAKKAAVVTGNSVVLWGVLQSRTFFGQGADWVLFPSILVFYMVFRTLFEFGSLLFWGKLSWLYFTAQSANKFYYEEH